MSEPIATEALPPDPDVVSSLPERPAIDHAPPGRTQVPTVVRRGGTPVLLTLFLFLCLAGAEFYAWTNPKPASGNDEALADLSHKVDAQGQAATELNGQIQSTAQTINQQIAALQARLDKLEKAAAMAPAAAPTEAPASPAPDTADIARRLDALDTRVQSLANAPAPAPAPPPAPVTPPDTHAVTDLAARVDQLHTAEKSALDTFATRIDKLEQGAGRVDTEANKAVRLSRVEQATAALAAGASLGDWPGAPPALARFATATPPTEAGLRAGFPAVGAQVLAVSRPDAVKAHWYERALARVEQSVTVRRGDQVIVGDPASGILDQAQTALDNGDLAGAVRSLRALQGPAAAAAADWVGRAQALLDARAALARLAAHP